MPETTLKIEALFSQAKALHARGLLAEARQLYHQVLEHFPEHAPSLYHLGRIAFAMGKYDMAVVYVQRALEVEADDVGCYVTLGLSLKAMRDMEGALKAYEQALTLDPNSLEARVNYGNTLHAVGRLGEAIETLRSAQSLAPTFAPTSLNLGNALKDAGRLEEAILCYQRAIELEPALAEAHNNLGFSFQLLGQLEEAIASYRAALALRPGFEACHSNLLFCLLYQPSRRPERFYAEQRRWDELHARPLEPKNVSFSNRRETGRIIRIGYVSPNFKTHSDAHFLAPLLRGHDRQAVSVTCFSDAGAGDSVTAELRSLSDDWHDTTGLTDSAFVSLVRSLEIDVLLDVAGLTRRHRLLAFAGRASPVQVSYHGFGSSGMNAMDYRLTDAVADPSGAERYHSERLLRLPRCFAAYEAPRDAPDIAPLGLFSRGFVQFGSFNNPSKINHQVIALWSRLMQEIKGSRLLLKYATFVSWAARQRMIEAFARQGIAPERLTLLPHTPERRAHLEHYAEVDIALDPFPYSGSVTTFEALWMGVPVVSLAGDQFIGRMSASLLTHIGCTDLVVDTQKRYIGRAKALAGDVKRLSELRQSLREKIIRSRLCDPEDMAGAVEQALGVAFSAWCENRKRE